MTFFNRVKSTFDNLNGKEIQDVHIQKLIEFKKLHDNLIKSRKLEDLSDKEKELIAIDEEFVKEYPEIRLGECGDIIPHEAFCAHGTNAWTIFSAFAFTNGQLSPKNEMKKIGMPVVSGEVLFNRKHIKNYGIGNQNFISTVTMQFPFSTLKDVYQYSNFAIKDGKHDYDILKRKYLKICKADQNITQAVTKFFNDKTVQETYEKLSSIPVVILGDGIGETFMRSDVEGEYLYERVNIRVIIVCEKDKEYVQNLVNSISQKTFVCLTKEEIDDFQKRRNYQKSFSTDFQEAFKDKLPFNLSNEFKKYTIEKKRIRYIRHTEENTLESKTVTETKAKTKTKTKTKTIGYYLAPSVVQVLVNRDQTANSANPIQQELIAEEAQSSTVSRPKKNSENNIKTTTEKVVSPTEVVETPEHIPADHSSDNHNKTQKKSGNKKRRIQFPESNQLLENKSEHDGWYRWIDHLISIEPNKAIEELKVDISELEEELIQLKDAGWLKSDIEIDLKLVKCLAQHFNNPEKIIKELKQYTDNKPRNSVNRINCHIILVKYFAEKMQIEMTQETYDFIESIEIEYRKTQGMKSSWKTSYKSPYAASDEKTAKQDTKEEYGNKLAALRNLIIYAKNNFDDDVHVRLLIRVNNCIVSNSKHNKSKKNTDLIINHDDIYDTHCSQELLNEEGNEKIMEMFNHAEKLRDCVKELLKISHGNFEKILGDIKDLMEPVLKQSDKELSPTMNLPQNPQAELNVNKARNIHDIFLARYSFASYASGEGVIELSAEEMRKINQYTEDIKKGSNEELNKFIKKIEEVRTKLMIAVDNLDHEIFKKYVSEGKVEVLKKYLHVAGQYFEITAGILKKLGYKDELEGEGVVAKKLKRIEKILNQNTQNQNGQLVVEAPSPTVSTPEEGIHNKPNPQATPKKLQSKPNVYDNKGFGKEIMVVVGAIVGTIIGATIAYFAGAVTLPIIVPIVVFSAAVGALIGYGIAEIYEKVSRDKQNDSKMGTLTALGEVQTTGLCNRSRNISQLSRNSN